MSWWDSIVDIGSSIWDFAKENPTTAGAIAGGAYNAATGKNIIEGVGAGAALGYGAGRIFGGTGTGVGSIPGTSAPTGGSASSVGAWTPSVNTTTIEGVNAASSGATQAATAGDFGGYLQGAVDKTSGVLSDVKNWGKQNKEVAQLGIQLVGGLQGNQQAQKLNDMRQQQLERQNAATDKNNALSDEANATARAYDPTNLGVRGYASAMAAGGRNLDAIDNSATTSTAAKTALKSKARVDASKAGVSAYQSGYDTGTRTQAGLRRNYSGGTYDSGLYGDIAQSNKDSTSNITGLLENYLGNPTAGLKRKEAEDQGVMQ